MNIKEDILNALKRKCPENRIVLPHGIDFEFIQNTLIMYLKKTAIGVGYRNSKDKLCFVNMQDDAAAFEGWAVIIKTFWNTDCDYNVRIDISDDEMVELPDPKDVFIEKKDSEVSSGHYGRFLYRANKFSEEFDWVCLSEKIKKCVDIYENLLEEYKCMNHLPDEDAGENDHPEIQAEASFHENPAEIEKLTTALITYSNPKSFAGSDGVEIQFDRQFENLCLVLSEQLHVKPKDYSVLEFYNAFDFVKERAKQAEKAQKRAKSGR